MMARKKATAQKRNGVGEVANVYSAGFCNWSTTTVLIECKRMCSVVTHV